jgi:hypothetical protein
MSEQVFYYIDKAESPDVAAIRTDRGLEVLLFSSMQSARDWALRVNTEGAGVNTVRASQLADFTARCNKAGATSLRFEPTEAAFKDPEWVSLS